MEDLIKKSSYEELCNYFRNFRDFENVIYKRNNANLWDAWNIAKTKKMTENELDKLIGQPISAEGYISHNKLYVPNCPYCGKEHIHDNIKYTNDKHIGTISTNRAKCEFIDCYNITIYSREDILKKRENEKDNNNKLTILFRLYNELISINDNSWINFKDTRCTIRNFRKYQIHKIYTELLEGVSLNEMMVIFQAGNIWNKLSQLIKIVHIKEFHTNKFPDLIGTRRNSKSGKLENVNIEFESISSNFIKHGHPQDKCDIIICWKHDWIGCPKNIEVIELSHIIDKNTRHDELERNNFNRTISNLIEEMTN